MARSRKRMRKKMTVEEAIAEERRQRREARSSRPTVGPSGDLLEWDHSGPYPAMRWRIFLLQMIATGSLFLMFYTNQVLNPDSFEVRSHLGVLQSLHIFWGSFAGIIIGGVFCLLPRFLERIVDNWENMFSFRYTRFRGIMTLISILTVITILIRPMNMYLFAVRAFIAFFYLSPLIFGMYGIWNLKGTHIITACMFSFFTAISRPKPVSDLGNILIFAIAFLMFAEVSASMIRQHILASEELVPVRFQTKMVDRYMVYLAMFSTLTLLLTYLALNSRTILNYFSPVWTKEAMEVQGFLGLIIPTVGVVLLVLFLKWVWEGRYKEQTKKTEEGGETKKRRSVVSRFLLPDTSSEAP